MPPSPGLPSSGFKTFAAIRLLVVAIALQLAACTIQLAPNYDPSIVNG